MITRFVLKDAHVPAEVVETMERRIHQRMDAYFKDEAEGDTVIGVRITEQKNTYKVEMTMPYMGHTLRTENQEREISLPALDKGIDGSGAADEEAQNASGTRFEKEADSG